MTTPVTEDPAVEPGRRRWLSLPQPTVADAIAGVSVALVLIPQSLAYAQIAEMPVVTGLFASALPLVVFALFASSPYLQTGPVALTSLLTLAALQGAGFDSSDENYVALAGLLALIVGGCRLIFGLARLGWLAYLIAEPVRMGFTSGAAIIIISSQLPKALGAAADAPDGSTLGRAIWAATHPGSWGSGALILTAMTLVVMLGGRRLHRLFPGVALAVVLGILYGRVDDSVRTVGSPTPIPEGLPSLSLDLPWGSVGPLLVGGIVIALVGFAEPASIAREFAKQDRSAWDANREFAASGLANLTAAVSGAFPVGGSFSRSSVNRMAGARTRWSGGVTGVVVLAFLSFASVLNGLPQAVLGAIVIGAVLSLVKPVALAGLWRGSKVDAFLGWVTFVATLALTPAVQWAVLLGVALTGLAHLIRPLLLTVSTDGDHTVVTPQGLLWLASYRSFEQQLVEITNDVTGDVTVDFSLDPNVDQTAEDIVERINDGLGQGRTIVLRTD